MQIILNIFTPNGKTKVENFSIKTRMPTIFSHKILDFYIIFCSFAKLFNYDYMLNLTKNILHFSPENMSIGMIFAKRERERERERPSNPCFIAFVRKFNFHSEIFFKDFLSRSCSTLFPIVAFCSAIAFCFEIPLR